MPQSFAYVRSVADGSDDGRSGADLLMARLRLAELVVAVLDGQGDASESNAHENDDKHTTCAG